MSAERTSALLTAAAMISPSSARLAPSSATSALPPKHRTRSLRAFASAPIEAGFTLVEMLAVIVIMGLIATMVTVNWHAMLPKAELNSAVRTLAAAIQSAHSEAISRNAVYRIEYDLDKHRYRINTPFKQGGGMAARDEDRFSLPWTALPQSVHFSHLQIDGVDYTNGMAFVRFDPLGAASEHVIMLVQKPYDNYYTIEVQALTGLIEYHEGQFVRLPPREADF